MSWINYTLIVPADKQSLAQDVCSGLAGASGNGMFSTPLSSNGLTPATHYISAGMIDNTFVTLLSDASLLYSACQQAGLPQTQSQLSGLLSACDISTENPFTAMARLGLTLIQATS